MIATVTAALAINNAFACDPYFTIGSGPYYLLPSIGVGSRFDDASGKVDVCLDYAFDSDLRIARVAMSKLFLVEQFYIGPSYSLEFYRMRFMGWHNGSSTNAGFVVGKDLGSHFIDMTVLKRVSWNKFKLNSMSVRLRMGINF